MAKPKSMRALPLAMLRVFLFLMLNTVPALANSLRYNIDDLEVGTSAHISLRMVDRQQ